MTLLLRRISDKQIWRACEKASELAQGSLPSWTYGEFVPRHQDGNGLSVFEVDDNDEARARLAAALSMIFDDQQLFLGVKRQSIEDLGILVVANDGKTFDADVNKWHRVIQIDTLEQVGHAAKIFVAGRPFRFEKSAAFAELRKRASSGDIDLMGAFGKNNSSLPRRVVSRLIECKSAVVQPGTAP